MDASALPSYRTCLHFWLSREFVQGLRDAKYAPTLRPEGAVGRPLGLFGTKIPGWGPRCVRIGQAATPESSWCIPSISRYVAGIE